MAYTKKVMEHFRNPHNYGRMENPDGVGKVGNVICGDVMWIYIKVKDKDSKELIDDIKFETFGCTSAIATSSIITDMAKGRSLTKALGIDKNQIVDSLGGLPPVKIHCSVLAADGLAEAIYDYLSKNKKDIPKELEKKHKRLEQEKRIIEEKYKDWTQAEMEMHKS